MDNILDKNIFKDKDLHKLSPDYRPVNVLLRMQIRRSLSKDTHWHGVHKTARKSFKKSKDALNINKDITKLRQEFNSINLKNRIALQCLDSVRHKPVIDYVVDECEPENEDLNLNLILHEFNDDSTDLMINNDTEFKLQPKVKMTKENFQKFDELKSQNKVHRKKDLSNVEAGCENNGSIFKVQCINNATKHQRTHTMSNAKEQQVDNLNQKNLPKAIALNNNLDFAESGLQKLLIMMAITSKSQDAETVDTDAVNAISNVDVHKDQNLPSEINLNIREDFSPANYNRDDEITSILNVLPLRIQITDKEKKTARKFVNKWKQYVVNRKKYLNEQREAALNTFFDKITKKKMEISQSQEAENKAKQAVRDYSNYQHRYKVQKHIIALQKMKLEEQNRMIDELKYNKIIEASRLSVDTMKEEVRKTYYEIDRQLKPKLKCLTNELKMHEIEEPSLVLHCLKVPQFLQRMEKRAREREEKHAIIRERRRQMEEERIRLKQQAELAKAEMDKEEKLRRMKELRERRKREKIDNIRRKQYAERMRALTVMADLHHEKTLMSKYGIRPLRILLDMKRDNIEKAKAHYRFQLKNNTFLHWMWYTEDMWYERNYKAEDFYRKTLLRKTFKGLKMNQVGYILKKQVAVDYYDFYVQQLVFRKFRQCIEIVKKENEAKWQKAVIYHNSNVLFKAFTCWRTLPALNALKREQEVRKARWREKVLQVVPDYTPPDD